MIFYLLHSSLLCVLQYYTVFNYITISCIYLFLTPNSRSAFRAGVSLNIHSFILSCHYSQACTMYNSLAGTFNGMGETKPKPLVTTTTTTTTTTPTVYVETTTLRQRRHQQHYPATRAPESTHSVFSAAKRIDSFPRPASLWENTEFIQRGNVNPREYGNGRGKHLQHERRERVRSERRGGTPERGTAMPAPRDAMPAPRDAMPAPRDAMIAPRDAMLAPRDAMPAPRDAMLAPRDAMPAPRDAMPAPRDAMLAPRDAMLAPRDAMLAPRDAMLAPRGQAADPPSVGREAASRPATHNVRGQTAAMRHPTPDRWQHPSEHQRSGQPASRDPSTGGTATGDSVLPPASFDPRSRRNGQTASRAYRGDSSSLYRGRSRASGSSSRQEVMSVNRGQSSETGQRPGTPRAAHRGTTQTPVVIANDMRDLGLGINTRAQEIRQQIVPQTVNRPSHAEHRDKAAITSIARHDTSRESQSGRNSLPKSDLTPSRDRFVPRESIVLQRVTNKQPKVNNRTSSTGTLQPSKPLLPIRDTLPLKERPRGMGVSLNRNVPRERVSSPARRLPPVGGAPRAVKTRRTNSLAVQRKKSILGRVFSFPNMDALNAFLAQAFTSLLQIYSSAKTRLGQGRGKKPAFSRKSLMAMIARMKQSQLNRSTPTPVRPVTATKPPPVSAHPAGGRRASRKGVATRSLATPWRNIGSGDVHHVSANTTVPRKIVQVPVSRLLTTEQNTRESVASKTPPTPVSKGLTQQPTAVTNTRSGASEAPISVEMVKRVLVTTSIKHKSQEV